MPHLQLVGGTNPHKSKTKTLATALEHAITDVHAAWQNLPPDMGAALQPAVEDFTKKAHGLIEMALVAGYRKGLVDFFEDDTPDTTT